MDFGFPAAAEKFRVELRDFIEEELPDWWVDLFTDDERIFPFTREFCMKMADRDWLTNSWPTEFGGAGSDIWNQMVVREEMWGNGEPRGPNI